MSMARVAQAFCKRSFCERKRSVSICHAYASNFPVPQASLWLRRRVESVVYLALPRRACVARWLCRIVGTGCFVKSEHDDCPADCWAGLPAPGALSRIRKKIVNGARMCSVLFVLNSGFRRFCTHDEPILYYRLSPSV
jgi:hypothetical protein